MMKFLGWLCNDVWNNRVKCLGDKDHHADCPVYTSEQYGIMSCLGEALCSRSVFLCSIFEFSCPVRLVTMTSKATHYECDGHTQPSACTSS